MPTTKDASPIRGDVAVADRHNMLFSGTAVASGHATAVVVATGMDTEMGRIAGLLRDTREETTPLQRELDRVGRLLGTIVVAITAAGTLLVLDASLPGGWIEGTGDMRYGHTMAFTTLVMFSLFTLFTARSDSRSAFSGLLTNKWLLAAALLSLLLQFAVVYVPALQRAFSTTSLAAGDWLRCAAAGSSILWFRELTKLVQRVRMRRRQRPVVPGELSPDADRAWDVVAVGESR